MIDHWVTVANLSLAILACIVNVVSALRGFRPARNLRWATAALAGGYIGAYSWLLLHPGRRVDWSRTMSGVASVAWVLVWILPAVLGLTVVRPKKGRS